MRVQVAPVGRWIRAHSSSLSTRFSRKRGRGALPKRGSPQQRIITVEPTDRVLQILAGPGSGKTEALVWRVLYELFVHGVASQSVMVTTFTRRAATELQVRLVERSDALLRTAHLRGLSVNDPKVHDLRIGTIHSLCDSLLAEFDASHVERGTQVIDETEVSVRMARDYRLSLGFNDPPKPPRVLNRLLSNPALTVLFRQAWEDNPRWPLSMMERRCMHTGDSQPAYRNLDPALCSQWEERWPRNFGQGCKWISAGAI